MGGSIYYPKTILEVVKEKVEYDSGAAKGHRHTFTVPEGRYGEIKLKTPEPEYSLIGYDGGDFNTGGDAPIEAARIEVSPSGNFKYLSGVKLGPNSVIGVDTSITNLVAGPAGSFGAFRGSYAVTGSKNVLLNIDGIDFNLATIDFRIRYDDSGPQPSVDSGDAAFFRIKGGIYLDLYPLPKDNLPDHLIEGA